MRLFCWIILGLLLGFSAGCSSGKEKALGDSSTAVMSNAGPTTIDIVLRTEIDVTADIAPPEEATMDIQVVSTERVREKKKVEEVSAVERVKQEPAYKTDQAYLSINRFETVRRVSIGKNQGQLKIELTRDIGATIRTADKPLVLGGDGFDTAGLDPDVYRLHFKFDSHMKVPPIHEVDKKDEAHLDPDLEKVQSEKFLVFHPSGSTFGRQPNLYEELKPEAPLEQRRLYAKVVAVPDTWVLLDQNKKTLLHLKPPEKPLDLIYDNPAILKHDYQVLNSGGS